MNKVPLVVHKQKADEYSSYKKKDSIVIWETNLLTNE